MSEKITVLRFMLRINYACLERSIGKNALCIHSLFLTMRMYYICFHTMQFNWFEQECIDLNHES